VPSDRARSSAVAPAIRARRSADGRRLEHLEIVTDGEQEARNLVGPVEPEAEPRPTRRVVVGQALGRRERSLADCPAEARHPIGSDPDRDLDRRRLALVGGARLCPERREVEAVGPFKPIFQRVRCGDPRNSIRAHLPVSARHDVPDAGLEDEPKRLEHPGHPSVAALVLD
jgi:hypothetical protein